SPIAADHSFAPNAEAHVAVDVGSAADVVAAGAATGADFFVVARAASLRTCGRLATAGRGALARDPPAETNDGDHSRVCPGLSTTVSLTGVYPPSSAPNV